MCIDWKMVSKRIYQQRKKMRMSREEVAEKIGRVPSYYADIERGTCGMSGIRWLRYQIHFIFQSIIFCMELRKRQIYTSKFADR